LKTIVFDVGRVLVDFCFENFKEFLNERGALIESTNDFFHKTNIFEYEKGNVSCQDFFACINCLLSKPSNREEIETKWRDIFTPETEMFELLDEISKIHPTYLLSNTNPSHWKYLENNFSLSKRVNGIMTSFEAKAMKPSKEIYEALIVKYSLKAENLIFIDDLKENIEAAKSSGWNGIHHTSFVETRKNLLSLLS